MSLNYQIFIIHLRIKKMVNYYLLQWVQAWKHMPCTSTLNKRQTERNYTEHIINLVAFGLVARQ